MAAAAPAVALAAALVERADTMGSGYRLDAVFPAPSSLPLADFFHVPPGLDLANGTAASDVGGGAADA